MIDTQKLLTLIGLTDDLFEKLQIIIREVLGVQKLLQDFEMHLEIELKAQSED